MDSFQKTTLVVAIIILIISLVFIGVVLKTSISSQKWPPMLGDCPDYWVDLGKNGSKCYNPQKIGSCNIPTQSNKNTMDFTTDVFTGDDGACNKKKWADRCSKSSSNGMSTVSWDGITYGVTDPCEKEE